MHTSNESSNLAKLILSINIGFIITDFVFVIITKRYSGDMLGMSYKLTNFQLVLVLICTCIPLFILFYIYKYHSAIKKIKKITIPKKFLAVFLFFLLIFDIAVTLIYGVARLGAERYNAPLPIKILIVIANRFDVGFGVCLYVIIAPKSKLKYILLPLLLVLSLGRASMGIFGRLFFLYILLNFHERILKFVIKRIVIIAFFICMLPIIVPNLYEFRAKLRNSTFNANEMNFTTLILGKLIGRIALYSNNAIIFEKYDRVMRVAKEKMEIFDYPFQSLPIPFNGNPDRLYAHLIQQIRINSSNYYLLTSLATGTFGVFIIGYCHSLIVLIINVTTIFLLIWCSFQLSTLFHYHRVNELFLMLLVGAVLSGAGREYVCMVLYPLAYILLFIVVNFLYKWNKNS